MSSAAGRLARVQERISAAAERSGRRSHEVTLVAISKTFPPSAIAELRAAGQRDFGENRAQELASKMRDMTEEDLLWHFVGHLQKNKARAVAGVALVHSIDSLHTAEALARRAERMDTEQRVLIEVNTSGEPTKSGVAPEDAISFAQHVDALTGLAVAGLMTIPALPLEPEDSRPAYKAMAALSADLTALLPAATELSMGMSRDFEVAIEEGATIVRVGEALFGPRPAASAPGT